MLPQKQYTYLWVVLLAFTLHACTPDDGPQPCNSTNTYFNLTAEQLNKTPYFTNPLFDTISFASNKGDTLTFALTKIDTTYFTQDANYNPNDQCSFWEHYQNITAKYTTIKGVGSFEVMQTKKNVKGRNYIEITFNNSVLFYYDDWVDWKGFKDFIGTITIDNKNYTNAFKIYSNSLDINSNFAVITKTHGLIQFDEKTKQLKFYYIP